MPVCTEDLDKANSRSHWNIRRCGGKKCGTKREHCKSYSKERHTGGLADRLDRKLLLFQLLPVIWSRWLTNNIYLVPKCCLFQWIFSLAGRRVDYDWANEHYFYRLFYTRGRDTRWFSAVYFWSALFNFWCESRTFSLSSFKTQTSSLRLSKLLGCLIFSNCLLDLNN